MRLVTWNVNGIRACIQHGFVEEFNKLQPDVLCLQEVKALQEQVQLAQSLPDFFYEFWYSAEKKGYSGTAILSRKSPIHVNYGINFPEFDKEGRVITLEFDSFFLVNVYTPNSRDGLVRLPGRLQWEAAFRNFLCNLDKTKPVLVCGDMNVAHKEIDLARPGANHRSAGFTDEERQAMTELLQSGFIDVFREFHPNEPDAYTWWSYRGGARARNVGWRIDYWLCSERFRENLSNCGISREILGSDHCPVWLELP